MEENIKKEELENSGGTASEEPEEAKEAESEEIQMEEFSQEEAQDKEDGKEEPEGPGEGDEKDGSDSGEEGESEDAEGKKGRFKKKKKDKRDEQIEELTDRLKRQMAEFENFRKRTEKEKSQMYDMGAKNIIEKILPVIDNFERGLAAVPEENMEDPFVDGMNKTYRQMMTILEEAGVKPIEAMGADFNPNFHNAVMHVEDEELGENVIVEELQKGYMYHDAVVRHSMVKVAN